MRDVVGREERHPGAGRGDRVAVEQEEAGGRVLEQVVHEAGVRAPVGGAVVGRPDEREVERVHRSTVAAARRTRRRRKPCLTRLVLQVLLYKVTVLP
ncbi:hypothetical protein GCM10010102_06870 [Promicromonospora citrea]|uniref:Uncharacterized protein n=1 Tax=Promicromonospora citrea TaxID=43677 RepID=A0A8H9L2K3_9MICO|nr:hypothetical protein GCM10010102_06870 [Promicromonospora citrea]